MGRTREKFQNDNQNYFQLASIQSAASGLSVILIGQQLSKLYGAGTAICSILLGNLILWLIGIAIISMVDRAHNNAIDNIKSYVGKYGSLIAALILVIAFLNWYAYQITTTMTEFSNLIPIGQKWGKDVVLRLGAALALLTALLSIGGIRLLRRLAVAVLPLLVCYCIYAVTSSSITISLKETWRLSFSAVLTSILTLLPGVINLPTFFRHSRSKAHSFLALSIMTILITFFEISTIWMKFSFLEGQAIILQVVLLSVFLILILTICNMLNIYLASACWEAVVPHIGGGKEYAIIGLFGTLTYTFVQISTPVQFIQDLTNSYIAILGVVLLMAYLLRIIVRHRLRVFEQSINLAAWIFGCIFSTIYEAQHFLKGLDALLVGVNASVLFFLGIIFVEETGWAIKNKWLKNLRF